MGYVFGGDFAVLFRFLDTEVFFELQKISFVVPGGFRALCPGVLKPDIL